MDFEIEDIQSVKKKAHQAMIKGTCLTVGPVIIAPGKILALHDKRNQLIIYLDNPTGLILTLSRCDSKVVHDLDYVI